MSSNGLIANKAIKLSWKCKQCRHYNSAHSAKCSSCVKYGCGNVPDCGVATDSVPHSNPQADDAITPVEEVEGRSLMVENNIYFLGTGNDINNAVSGLDSEGNHSPKRQISVSHGQVRSKVCKSSNSSNVSATNDSFNLNKSSLETLDNQVTNNCAHENLVCNNNNFNANNNNEECESWTCKRCTLKNPVDFEFCEVCEAPRKSNIPTTLPKKSKFNPSALNCNKINRAGRKSQEIVLDSDSDRSNLNVAEPVAQFVCSGVSVRDNSPVDATMDKHMRASSDEMVECSGSDAPPLIDLSGGSSSSRTADEDLDVKEVWVCSKCSFGYNPEWSTSCDMCDTKKGQPGNSESRKAPSRDLDDDFQLLTTDVGEASAESPEQSWTCIKCTLVNSGSDNACKVCGGSRLKSICYVDSATLKKGEFWTCSVCTLKNPIFARRCKVCKAKVDGTGGTKDKLNTIIVENKDKENKPKPEICTLSESTSAEKVSNVRRKSVIDVTESEEVCPVSPDPIIIDSATDRPGEIEEDGAVAIIETVPVATKPRCSDTSTNAEVSEPSKSCPALWTCSACTFNNNATAVSCAMCGSSPTLENVKTRRPANETYRGQSELMDVLREVEEQEALDKWKRIVHYCRVVSIILCYYIFHQYILCHIKI